MKKSFKIKKSVVESMVDNAIRSLLNEAVEPGSYKDAMEKERGFDYDDLSQDVMHWALNYADSGHNYPINALEAMYMWYNGDDSALDNVYEMFADWKGIECDENVRSAVEKAAIQIGYYENWNNDETELDETKEAQAVEDMKKKIRSMSQKISSTGEELPELKRQLDALKNKLSTMDESFRSQKLKDFARKHGLKQGNWSADFKNDLYNMSDEDFDDYAVVNPELHYMKYGVNGLDKTGYSNNNFQPLTFGDGTFMVKKHPELRWDDRARAMMDKQIDRRNSRRNDGKNEYQFENPYLNDKFNQEYHISKPRGSWGYGTDWKLEPSNINMTALRSMEGYDRYPGDVQHGDVAAKAKASRKGNVSESKLNTAIQKSIKTVLKESDIWDIGYYRSKYESEKQATEQFAKEILSGMYDEKLLDENDTWLDKKLSHVSDDDAQYIIACVNKRMEKLTKKVLNEGIYDYPDGIDNIIFLSENDRELYEEYRQIAKACMKLYKKDVQLTLERLMESSIMKRYQQHCFRKYAKEQQGLDRMNSPREFRRFIAEKIIDEVVNGDWDDKEMMNESENINSVWVDSRVPGIGKSWYYGGSDEMNLEQLQTLLDKYDAAIIYKSEYYEDVHQVPFVNDFIGLSKYGMPDEMGRGYYQKPTVIAVPKGTVKINGQFEFPEGWSSNLHAKKYGVEKPISRLREEIKQPKQYGYQNVPDDFVEKVGENGYDVLVPDWCLPYLVNGDRDIYEDDEIAAMDAFVEKYNGKLAHGLNPGDVCVPMDGEEPSFYTHNDITGNEGCDCYRVFLPAKESEQMY